MSSSPGAAAKRRLDVFPRPTHEWLSVGLGQALVDEGGPGGREGQRVGVDGGPELADQLDALGHTETLRLGEERLIDHEHMLPAPADNAGSGRRPRGLFHSLAVAALEGERAGVRVALGRIGVHESSMARRRAPRTARLAPTSAREWVARLPAGAVRVDNFIKTRAGAGKLINVRSAVDNPFSPGSDVVPPVWAGRDDMLNDWRTIVRPRRLIGVYERGRTILGEPGLGKSSLVRRIAADAAAAGDWVTPQLRIPSGGDALSRVAKALLALAATAGLSASREERIVRILTRVQAVGAAGVSLTLRENEGVEAYTALADLLVEVGAAAMRRRDTMVVVHIDEVQNIASEDMLSQLLIALGDALAHQVEVTAPGGIHVRRALPIAVYLTGLPDFEDRASSLKGATFARRFKTSVLAPLTDGDLRTALQPFVFDGWQTPDDLGGLSLVTMTAEASAFIVAACCGEPFLFQLAGSEAWNAATTDVITLDDARAGWRKASSEAAAHVERILNRLPARETDFLRAMAALPAADRNLTRIALDMGLAKAADAGPTSQRLDTVRGIIERGRPYTFKHRAVEAYLTTEWPRTVIAPPDDLP